MTPAQTQSWILTAVCERFGVTEDTLLAGKGQRTTLAARAVAAYLLTTLARLSLSDAAKAMRCFSGTSITKACEKVKASDELLAIAVALSDEHDGLTAAESEALGPRPHLTRRSSAIIATLNADPETRDEVLEYLRGVLSVKETLHRQLAQQRADAAHPPATVQGAKL